MRVLMALKSVKSSSKISSKFSPDNGIGNRRLRVLSESASETLAFVVIAPEPNGSRLLS